MLIEVMPPSLTIDVLDFLHNSRNGHCKGPLTETHSIKNIQKKKLIANTFSTLYIFPDSKINFFKDDTLHKIMQDADKSLEALVVLKSLSLITVKPVICNHPFLQGKVVTSAGVVAYERLECCRCSIYV